MALDRFNENMDIIGGLGDDPKLDDGLSTPQFKSVFDKAGLLIQKFLNEKLIPQIENFLDEGTVLGKIAEALSGKLDKTGGTMEGPVNMSGQSLSGLNAPTKDDEAATKWYTDKLNNDTENYVNNAVRTAAPRNLLDNSNFRNPVNQRGATSLTSVGYFIDRWATEHTDNPVLSLGNGYLTVGSGHIMQRVPEELIDGNKIYTIAAMKVDGTLLVASGRASDSIRIVDRLLFTYSYDMWRFYILEAGDYLWAALYEGKYTAETLPFYQPKGYSVELTECLRYYYSFIGYIRGSTNETNAIVANFFFPVIMRTIPTISMTVTEGVVPRVLNVSEHGVSVYDAENLFTIRTYKASADL